MEIFPWTPLQTPSTPGKCNSFTAKPMMLKFGKNLLHLINKNDFKFDTNPNQFASMHKIHYWGAVTLTWDTMSSVMHA